MVTTQILPVGNFYYRNAGMTLLELLLVMVIIALAVALVIPRIGSSHTAILQAQAREIAAVLKHGQRTAIVRGQAITVVIEARLSKPQPAQPTPKSLKSDWKSHSGVDLKWEAKPHAEQNDTTQGHFQFTFYPEGGSSGGTLILDYQERQAKINVNPVTGKVTTEFGNASS